MSAVMHAPLTGIFLIAELTGGYQLFIPLIIVTISSYLTINIFEHHSIYAVRLAKQGKLLTHHTDKSILTLMSMDKIRDMVKFDGIEELVTQLKSDEEVARNWERSE